MAVGKQNSFPTGKSFTARLKTKDGEFWLDTPEWQFEAKDAAGEYTALTPEQIQANFGVAGPIRDVAGDLISINTRVGSFNDEPIHNVTIGLRDYERDENGAQILSKPEYYYVGFVSNNNLGRSIANSLLNLSGFSNVQLGLWAQENKELKRRFAACSIRQGTATETIKRKYDTKTAPEMQPRIFEGKNNKQEKDYTKVDAFLFSELGKLGEILKAARGSSNTQTQAPVQEAPKSETPKAPAPAAQENLDEDVPF